MRESRAQLAKEPKSFDTQPVDMQAMARKARVHDQELARTAHKAKAFDM